MPNSAKKTLQLYRNEIVFEPSEGLTALQVAKQELASLTLNDGEVIIARYQEENDIIRTVLAVAHTINNERGLTFFTENAGGGSIVETDPIFVASAAYLITSQDITNWNSKTSNIGTVTEITMNGVSKGTSGNIDLGTVLTAHQDISTLADGAEYDSTNKLIYLKHGSTRLSNPINATAFIKDGMVNDVTVGTGTGQNVGVTCLIVSFNTDAGKEDIELPISQIFNPTNYYTKTETDNVIKDLDKVPYIQVTPSSSSQTIEPYKMYDLGTVSTALTIVFDTSKEVSGYVKEYIIRFVAGSSCNIILPNGTLYPNGTQPTYVSGRTYEINIVNNCAVIGEFY